jgi:ubiquinone/menaquinone biosynthesis C-methylase UbiE
MIEGEIDAAAMARTQELLDQFLTDRSDRTLQAYRIDLDDFARFLDATPPAAAARLLAGGPEAGRRTALEFMIDLRRRDLAQATIDRRMATLRALLRIAQERGFVEWQLDVPGEEEASAAMERRPARESEHYVFPRHPGEVDRLDIQHYALRELLQANYLAPLKEPRRILDVGCGTAQWAFEMCEQFSPALVVGLDLVSGKAGQPPNYQYVRGNVLHGLPFADNQFDFVHQRLLTSGVPSSSWSTLVADLARVTRPGGWVELVETPWDIERAGPATQRLLVLTRELTASLGLDTTGVVYRSLQDYLRTAGLVSIVRHQDSVPIGPWGGTVGSLWVTDFRAAATRVCEVLQARGRLSADEARNLVDVGRQECEHGRMYLPLAVAFGQKAG